MTNFVSLDSVGINNGDCLKEVKKNTDNSNIETSQY